MSAPISGVRIVQALGIAGSAFVSGSILSISFITTPALLDYPSQLASQWSDVYTRGSRIMPPLALLSSSMLAYSSYALSNHGVDATKPKLYALAALLTIGIVPYTFGVMWNTNNKLKARNDEIGVMDKAYVQETAELAKKWNWLNAGRGALPLMGSLVGIVALVL
ncbi:DUF1772-domain-containing protein [Dendrothele bispora CBS 962.96]|uniref:DUF1772-domain-containing protein n=1 Tax=Dendrothele bispora (strain CBS 962.96) TaxID=1314807 RepID=A0A4S8L940_DENBC|nr:DUF1772-domain-containing protein [Dendrothele bispora CBS 962.96]